MKLAKEKEKENYRGEQYPANQKFEVWEFVCPHPSVGGRGSWVLKFDTQTIGQLKKWYIPPWVAATRGYLYSTDAYTSCCFCYAIPIPIPQKRKKA